MKTIARIAATASAALAAVVSVFVAAPAFASEEGAEGITKIDTLAEFSSAGDPVQVGPILIVGFVLLAIVLLSSLAIGNLFEKN